MERIIDPRLFRLEAAHIDWLAASRQAGEPHSDALSERSRLTCALRWHVAAHRGNYQAGVERGIGLPTGPFQVFRRPSINLPPLPVASTEVFGWPFLLDTRVRRFDDLYGMIRVDVEHAGRSDGRRPGRSERSGVRADPVRRPCRWRHDRAARRRHGWDRLPPDVLGEQHRRRPPIGVRIARRLATASSSWACRSGPPSGRPSETTPNPKACSAT